MSCASATRFLAALGIFDFPVYGLATYGTKGACCFIVDVDRDGTEFDIAEETGILRCADFFGMVNRSAADLLARFEQAKPSLLELLKSEEGRASLSWTSRMQLEEVWPGGVPPEVDGEDSE
ncbi:hypothetical protein BD309DRAFT_861339 [Dichomitus squalens]|uniref:Uncharacterized protein n=1 Tax=Dichomitus squalens TaxID=114155 RepID=A0A4Q9NVX6_9APHY|nr:hypothetical protein BD309DRAFT_861339 [Dichomitus squalens]TBU54804.1 hypothetical protein BD310DRAFT_827248 [Dichomitus squalens]